MSLITQLQRLEPGADILLFELDGSDYGADVLRFHGHAIPHTSDELTAAGADVDQLPAKPIYWQGEEYSAWPVQLDGVEANSDGTAVRPTFAAGNVNGRITALCLAFEDLLEFKLTMRHTLGQYLDAENFPAGNPDADPTQESIEVWLQHGDRSKRRVSHQPRGLRSGGRRRHRYRSCPLAPRRDQQAFTARPGDV
ncbi:tail protein [Pseudomonas syringae CC1557]|uniref:Tail protein n=1 Tax=Pseudomonas syringae CC1557 TaxID=1357279 RepID=W0MRP9_PSESX|nr:tail protein [Pseudomonas syringae CC1557]